MEYISNILLGLWNIPLLSNHKTRSLSAENPKGEVGGGAKEIPQDPNHPSYFLGKGWKVRPCINLPKESTTVLAEIEGPGVIQHIWMTVDEKAYRDCILRFYWDEEEFPSVEVPLGDFFVNGHGMRYNVNSLPIVVNPSGGFNCYFPMPFKKSCKITIENQRWEDINYFFYQITYSLGDIPENVGYFHAQWRRSITEREKPENVILDGVQGKGHYVGTALYWTQLSNGWWGEGELKFYIDDDEEYPTICGTGTEDYFGGAWGFGETYSTPFLGYPLWRKKEGEVPKHAMYRWHILDPIRFEKRLKVTIQALGWWPNGKFQPLMDDISSVAYWYQKEPHNKFPEIPSIEERWPR
ncbi:MAG: DUF2961 domain-containing protein [Dictyoglomaceae bacterium]|nr:DUF2961 domain-containing protein [Dictyoglomaceae bacterium]